MYVIVIPWTCMSGLPDMYTQSQKAEELHIRQTMSGYGITVMCHCHSLVIS